MHLSFGVLSILSKALDARLKGYKLVHAFSLSKNRIVFAFWKDDIEFFIQITFENRTAYFQFFDSFNRPKRNFLFQFRGLEGSMVSRVQITHLDRSFYFVFTDGNSLLFKMHGPFSNLLQIDSNEEVIEIFRKNFPSDLSLKIKSLHKSIDYDVLKMVCSVDASSLNEELTKHFPFLQSELRNHHFINKLQSAQPNERVGLINNLIENPSSEFYITKNENFELLNYLPGNCEFHSSNIFEALNQLARLAFPEIKLRKVKLILHQHLDARIHAVVKASLNANQHLLALKNYETYETNGHLLMANIHSIPDGLAEVVVEDLYNSGTRKIRLEKRMSVVENARRYYSKSKAFKIEIPRVELQIIKLNNELNFLQGLKDSLVEFTSIKDLNTFAKSHNLLIEEDEQIEIPFKQFEKDGYEIWVGKNNKNNDLLTQSYAQKNDLWFHARDVAGSHVILRAKGGSPFPKPVIEYAAGLAAGHSKGKTQNLCPVQYCLRKFVTRPRGAAPGQVVLLKEEVILVEPIV